MSQIVKCLLFLIMCSTHIDFNDVVVPTNMHNILRYSESLSRITDEGETSHTRSCHAIDWFSTLICSHLWLVPHRKPCNQQVLKFSVVTRHFHQESNFHNYEWGILNIALSSQTIPAKSNFTPKLEGAKVL